MKALLEYRASLSLLVALAVLLALAGCGGGGSAPEGGSAEESETPATDQERTDSPAPRAEAPKTPPRPAYETVRKTVPTGTTLQLSLATDLASDTNVVGDRFEARLEEPVVIDRLNVIPAGSTIIGVVTEVQEAKKFTGNAKLTLSFTELQLPTGYRTALNATLVSEGEKTGKKSAAIIGGSAAGGALLGKVIGKDTKGSALGAIIGGAIGAGVAAKKDKELRVPAGTAFVLVTEEPLEIPVRIKVEG